MFSDSWCDWSVQPCTKHLVGVAKFCYISGCDREESVEIRYAEGLRGRHMESLAGVAQGTRTDPKVSTGLLTKRISPSRWIQSGYTSTR